MKMEVTLPFYGEMPDKVCAKARRVLRRELRTSNNILKNDGEADVAIEQVWNAIVGHDKIKFDK